MSQQQPIIRLVPFKEEDIPRLINWLPTEDALMVWGGLSFRFPLTQKQYQKHLKEHQANPPNQYIYKAVHVESERVVGHCELTSVNRGQGLGRISRVLIGSPEDRGKGWGQAMLAELLDFAFSKLHLHRIDLGVFDFNDSAIACYEQLGFRNEGTMREARYYHGQYWNLCVMSLLSHEWRGKQS